MANPLLMVGLADDEYLARYTTGFDALRVHVADWTPDRVAPITGLPEEPVEAFAYAWATTTPATGEDVAGWPRTAVGWRAA